MTRGVLVAWPLIPRVVALRPAALAVECGGAAGAGGGMAAAGPGGGAAASGLRGRRR